MSAHSAGSPRNRLGQRPRAPAVGAALDPRVQHRLDGPALHPQLRGDRPVPRRSGQRHGGPGGDPALLAAVHGPRPVRVPAVLTAPLPRGAPAPAGLLLLRPHDAGPLPGRLAGHRPVLVRHDLHRRARRPRRCWRSRSGRCGRGARVRASARLRLVVALEPVVGDRLPLRGVGDEGAPARPHSGITVEGAHAHAHLGGVVGVAAEEVRPHSPQKHFSKPPSAWRHARTSSSPWTNRKVRPSMRACADAAPPVRFWQRCSGSSRRHAPAPSTRSARRRTGSHP